MCSALKSGSLHWVKGGGYIQRKGSYSLGFRVGSYRYEEVGLGLGYRVGYSVVCVVIRVLFYGRGHLVYIWNSLCLQYEEDK